MQKIEATRQSYSMQAAWLGWMQKRVVGDLSWNKILYRYSASLTQFIIKAHLNVLPTLSNLRRWHISNGVACALCTSPAPLSHSRSGRLSVGGEGGGETPARKSFQVASQLCVANFGRS